MKVLCCEGGSEVGCVGGDHDEGEQVPHARYEPADGDQEGGGDNTPARHVDNVDMM